MISVVMGVYNAKDSVRRAAQSILCGTYKDIELIMVDDGSTDGTAEVLKELKAQDQRCVVLTNDKNRGLTYSLNRGLQAARGEFIARMDADDFSHPQRLEKQLEFLTAHPEYAFVGSAARLTFGGEVYGERKFNAAPDKSYLASLCPFIHPSILVRREAYAAVNGYRDKKFTVRCEDYDLYFRMYAKKLYGYNLNDALVDYEENPNDNSKHTAKTRLNEFCVRMRGCTKIARPLGYFKALRCLILIFVPKKIYFYFKNKRKENIIFDKNRSN